VKILDHYIALTLIKVTLLVLFSLVLLFSFFALVDQLDDTGRGNYGVWQAITFVFLTTPRLTFELFPIAAVIGSMTTLGMFAKNSEVTGLRIFISMSLMKIINCGQARLPNELNTRMNIGCLKISDRQKLPITVSKLIK
jgi:hypothetical protein